MCSKNSISQAKDDVNSLLKKAAPSPHRTNNKKVRATEVTRTEKCLPRCCDTFSAYNKGREYIFTYSTPLLAEIFKCVARLLYYTFIDISSSIEQKTDVKKQKLTEEIFSRLCHDLRDIKKCAQPKSHALKNANPDCRETNRTEQNRKLYLPCVSGICAFTKSITHSSQKKGIVIPKKKLPLVLLFRLFRTLIIPREKEKVNSKF